MSTASRRTKWHPTPPPPPSPKILYLPRRRRTHRRKQAKPQNNPLPLTNQKYANLESLFYQENSESHGLLLNSSVERRERVEEREDDEGFAEEKWRFQAEMLRAECNLLRMERELALKKLEKNRVKMETTLRSAVQTLQSGRKKIEEGKNGNTILEEEIEDLAERIEELQKSTGLQESEVRNHSNFDKKACLVQRRLEKFRVLSNENRVDEMGINMNKCGITNESRVPDNKSTDEALMAREEKCTGHCKAVVLRIVEQVRAETEQWSQMQKMLEKVRGEMEELQASRDYWEREAHNSDHQAQSLRHAVEAWKTRALEYEKQVQELELKLSLKTRADKPHVVAVADQLPLGAQLVKERHAVSCNSKKATPEKLDVPPLSLAKQLAKEKRSLIRSLKENLLDKGSKQELQIPENGGRRRACSKRSPLRDIANSSPPETQSHRIAFDYRSPESWRIRESFRK